MFCAAQPRVLKASVTPTALSPEVVALTMVASMAEVFFASVVRLLPVVISLAVMAALAPLRTRLVEIRAFTASDLPVPKALPPEDETVPSVTARISAFSVAVTLMSPTAVTAAPFTYASTLLRTSFLTTMPPAPVESDPVTFRPDTMSVTLSLVNRFQRLMFE